MSVWKIFFDKIANSWVKTELVFIYVYLNWGHL